MTEQQQQLSERLLRSQLYAITQTQTIRRKEICKIEKSSEKICYIFDELGHAKAASSSFVKKYENIVRKFLNMEKLLGCNKRIT